MADSEKQQPGKTKTNRHSNRISDVRLMNNGLMKKMPAQILIMRSAPTALLILVARRVTSPIGTIHDSKIMELRLAVTVWPFMSR